MEITLRDYQQECLDAIHKFRGQGKYRLLLILPTAAGKTVIFTQLIKELIKELGKGVRIMIMAHTQELLEQADETLKLMAPDIKRGYVDGDHKEFNAQVVIASTQSACVDKNLKQLKAQDFDVLIFDECHHSGADGARKVINELGFGKGTKKLLLGFTATGFRGDDRGLGEIFEAAGYECSTKRLIDSGWLVPPVGYKIATDIDFSGLKSVDGDFQPTSLAAFMNTPKMNKLIVESYISKASGLQAICFGVNVQHAKNLTSCFMAQGIAARFIDGEMPKKERARVIADYKAGKTMVLVNCQILTEGVNLPMCSAVIIARPTKSKGLYIQMVGRGLRKWPNKKSCVVLDFSDKNHSLVSTSVLLDDAAEAKESKQNKKSLLHKLPDNLNPKFKAVILNHNLFDSSFAWVPNKDGSYDMRGAEDVRIAIQRIYDKEDRYCVMFYDEHGGRKRLAQDVTFEWAFSVADAYAEKHRKLFTLSDLDAPWRDEPISEKQENWFRSRKYTAGVNQLTKGQADIIIKSGVLRKEQR